MRSLTFILFLSTIIFSCSSQHNEKVEPENPIEDKPEHLPSEAIGYHLFNYNEFVLNGRVQLEKQNDNQIAIFVELDESHQDQLEVGIYSKSIGDDDAEEILKLSSVNPGERNSTTIFTNTDLDNKLDFDTLFQSDLHIEITLNDSTVYFSELGSNALTLEHRKYHVKHGNNDGEGEFVLMKRMNGDALSFFKILDILPSGFTHDAFIRKETYADKIDRDVFQLFKFYTYDKDFVSYNALSNSMNGDYISYDELNNNSYHFTLAHRFPTIEAIFMKADLGISEKTDEHKNGMFFDIINDRLFCQYKLVKRVDGTAVLETRFSKLESTGRYFQIKILNHKNNEETNIGMARIDSYDEINIALELSSTYEQLIHGDYSYQVYNERGELVSTSKI